MSVTVEMVDATIKVNRCFNYAADLRINDRWSILDVGDVDFGDCDDYALTTAWLLSGQSTARLLMNVLRGKLDFHYCKTDRGERHLILEYRGHWIDSISRAWMDESPHRLRFRAPLPLVAFKMLGNVVSIGLIVVVGAVVAFQALT